MDSFRPLAGKALTTLLAGFAAIRTSVPNMILVLAFCAALCFNFSGLRAQDSDVNSEFIMLQVITTPMMSADRHKFRVLLDLTA